RAEVLPGDDVASAPAWIRADRLAIADHDDHEDRHDQPRDRQDQPEGAVPAASSVNMISSVAYATEERLSLEKRRQCLPLGEAFLDFLLRRQGPVRTRSAAGQWTAARTCRSAQWPRPSPSALLHCDSGSTRNGAA